MASLLDQERPNIFTQSVANILPGEQVKITISYVETLSYENGAYEFVFPMVVGPRYMPGTPTAGSQGNGFAPDTDQRSGCFADHSKVTSAGMRSGHDISLEVTLDAGLIVDNVDFEITSRSTYNVRILAARACGSRKAQPFPTKISFFVTTSRAQAIQDAVLTHRSGKGGFFTLILQPPERVARRRRDAEGVGVCARHVRLDAGISDREGERDDEVGARQSLSVRHVQPHHLCRRHAHPLSTTSACDRREPEKGAGFLQSRAGAGGTEMMTAIKAALEPSDDQVTRSHRLLYD